MYRLNTGSVWMNVLGKKRVFHEIQEKQVFEKKRATLGVGGSKF